MDTNQKVNQIMQALQMREDSESITFPGQRISTLVIKGDEKTALITELVRLLTAPEVA